MLPATRSLNPRQIEAFRAVMVSGSITGAGRLLSISQPAVTRLIKNLETDLGMRLFARVGATVAPTLEARTFFTEVERYFIGTERLREAAAVIRAHGAGRIRLAAINAITTSCLPAVVAEMIAEFPEVLLSTHTGVSPEIIDLVARGQVDMGIVALPPGHNDLAFRPLPQSEAVCVLPVRHPLALHPTIGPADLHGQDYVSLSATSLMRMELHALIHKAGAHPRPRAESLFSTTVVDYVSHGLGMAVVDPLAALHADPALTAVRRFVPRIRYELSVIFAPNVGESPVLKRLQAILTGHYRQAIAATEALLQS